MRLAWATDLHLDTAKQPVIEQFCEDVLASDVSAILVGGDISEAKDLERWLEFLDSRLRMPVYFVLGNHDYYGSDVATVRDRMRQLDSEGLRYLPAVGQVQLSPDLALVGHDGWGDCRIGDLDRFEILTDYMAIRDLRETINPNDLLSGFFKRAPLRQKLGELGDEAAETLCPDLLRAAETGASVLVLTHVPPFREACWHQNATSTATWLPGFTCRAIGDLVDSVAERHPKSMFTVLCGHTHGSGYVRMRPNLDVYTGFGDYGILRFGIVQAAGEEISIEPPESP